jgi:hypothetical protein
MSISDIVSISITANSVNVTEEGFGTPMILSHNASWLDRTRTYSTLAGMVADGFAATSPEYLAASAMLAQNPSIEQWKVGRAALDPTQRYKITVLSVVNSTVYSGTVNGVAWTYTSDASATNDEIATGIAAAIDAAQTTHTGTTTGGAGSLIAQILGDAAGNWCGLSVDDVTLLKLEQDHADPGVATDLAAIKVIDDDWYGLVTLYNSKAYVVAAAAWCEANKKIYCADTADTEVITVASASATDVAETLKDSAYSRTFCFYHPDTYDMAAASMLGRCLPLDPGTETWAFKTLAGLATSELTSTHLTNLRAKKANFYNTVAGVNITRDGKMASGDFVDLIRFRDFFEARLGERIFRQLAAADKVPQDDEGIALIEGEIIAQIQDGQRIGAIGLTGWSVTVPKIADVPTADREDRHLTGVSFSFTYSGAIHKVTISGVVNI